MSTVMKVTVELSVELNSDAWNVLYGNSKSSRKLRNSVREYVLGEISMSPAVEAGAIREVAFP
jgi:hypothetical protein